MTLVNNIWYDNILDNLKVWRVSGYNHEFGILPNSEGIPIIKCTKCKLSRMWIGLFETKECK